MTWIQIHVEKTRNLDLMIIEKFALITKCASHYLPAFYFKLAPAVVLSVHCLNFNAFHVFFLSTKQNLLSELDGIQSDFTALKLKNEELKVSYQDASQEVCQT